MEKRSIIWPYIKYFTYLLIVIPLIVVCYFYVGPLLIIVVFSLFFLNTPILGLLISVTIIGFVLGIVILLWYLLRSIIKKIKQNLGRNLNKKEKILLIAPAIILIILSIIIVVFQTNNENSAQTSLEKLPWKTPLVTCYDDPHPYDPAPYNDQLWHTLNTQLSQKLEGINKVYEIENETYFNNRSKSTQSVFYIKVKTNKDYSVAYAIAKKYKKNRTYLGPKLNKQEPGTTESAIGTCKKY